MARRILAALMILSASTLILSAGAAAQPGVRIGTMRQVNYVLPFVAADAQRLWREQGVEVKWSTFKSGRDFHGAVAAGSIDMGVTQALSTIRAVTGGVPEVIVADMKTVDDFILWVRGDSPIKGPRGLTGKRLGVSRLGGASHALSRLVLRKTGMENDVKIVGLGGMRQQIAAMRAGKVEGVVSTVYQVANLKQRGEVRELLNTSDYLPKEWSTGIILARRDFLRRNPGAVRKVVKAVLGGGDFIMKNRKWAIKNMMSTFDYSEQVAKLIYPQLRWSQRGRVNRQGLKNVRKFLIQNKIIKREKAPAIGDLYSDKF